MTEIKLNLDGLVTTVTSNEEGICAYDLLNLFIGQMRAQTFHEKTVNSAILACADDVKEDYDGK